MADVTKTDLPFAEDLFPTPKLPLVEDLFPIENEKDKPPAPMSGAFSDNIFAGDPLASAGFRTGKYILDAYGQGHKDGWGISNVALSKDTEEYLKKAGVYADYSAGQHEIMKAASEALYRGSAMDIALREAGQSGVGIFGKSITGAARGANEFGPAAIQAELADQPFLSQQQQQYLADLQNREHVPVEKNPILGPVAEAGKDLAKWGEHTFPVTEEERKAHPIASVIGSGAGAVVPVLGLGVVNPAAGLAAAAALFGLSAGEETYQSAIASGADEKTAQAAAGLSTGANAALGTLPVANVLKPFARFAPEASSWAVRTLAKAGQNGVVFSAFGEVQHYLNQEIAKIYNDKAEYEFDSNRVIGGFILGAGLGAVHQAIESIKATRQTTVEDVKKAADLKVIGPEGEAGYMGIGEARPELLARQAEMQALARQMDAEAAKAKAEAEPAAAPAAAPEPVPDVHAVAREIAPEVFSEYDALAAKRGTYRRWISELDDARNQDATGGAPHAEQIANLEARIADPDTTPRLRKKYEARLEPLVAERDAFLEKAGTGDSGDMARIRKLLQDTDYRMRDLAPEVAKAYQEARARVPEEPAVDNSGATPLVERMPAEAPAAPAEVSAIPPELPLGQTAQGSQPVPPPPLEAPKPGAAPAVEPPKAAPERISAPPVAIVNDVAAKLTAAGRPAEEAQAAAQIVAAYWETRAARFNGAKGTAEEMYAREAPELRGVGARAPEPPPVPAAKIAEEFKPAPTPKPPVDEPAAIDVMAPVARGVRARPEQTWSLMEFLADRGGITPNERNIGDLRSIFGKKNRFIPGFGQLIRPNGMTFDRAFEAAKEAGYFHDQADITGTQAKLGIRELLDALDREARGEKQYRIGQEAPEKAVDPAQRAHEMNGALDTGLASIEIDPASVTGKLRDRVIEIMDKEGVSDPVAAYERATMEVDEHGTQAGRLEPREEYIPGWDVPDDAQAARGSREATAGEQGARGERPSDASRSVSESNEDARLAALADDFFQGDTKRGKIRIREDGRNTITLLKDANASTFMHETGHDWLARMMDDARDPLAPPDLVADAGTVLKWLGVEKSEDIKTKQHEKFARGFENYLMEGRAPSRALADVFAKFRDWLVKIYQTAVRLRAPLNDDVRAVFDRLLAHEPEKTVIVPEREAPKAFADIHETDADSTAPAEARPVAQTIQAERDKIAAEQIPEIDNARLEGVDPRVSEREPRGPQPDGTGDAAGSPAGEGERVAPSRKVGEGGDAPAQEGPRPPVGAGEKTEPPAGPGEHFTGPVSPLVDKAGNIRLDNLGTTEDVNRAIRDAAAASDDFIAERRGVITDGMVLELADALGMDPSMLSKRKLGEAFNAEQIMASRKLLVRSATAVRDAMRAAATGSPDAILAYAEAKERHLMIQGQVAGLTAEAGRALRAFRAIDGAAEANELADFLKKETGKTLFQLQREAQLGLQLATPAEMSRFLRETKRPTLKDMVIEAWMAFVLSGLKTHVANISGNVMTTVVRPIETVAAAAVGKLSNVITGSKDRVYFGEAAAELYGNVMGSREGIVAGYKAFMTEDAQVTSTKQTEQQHVRAIPSVTVNVLGREMQIGGKQVRVGLRALTAEDEFFKAVAFRGSIHRQAYAEAMKLGLEGEKAANKAAELALSPSDEMIAAAKKDAEYQTFQTPLGETGRSVQRFANSHLLAKLVVPFVRTPLNLLKYAIKDRTPLGLFSAEVRDNMMGKNGGVARDTQIARMSLGTLVGVAVFEMAAQGLITGNGPANKDERATWIADGNQPYSVRIGDMMYAYNRFDPFSIIMGIAADFYEVNKAMSADDPEAERLTALVFAAITNNIVNRASLKGPSDLIQALSDPERYGKGYIKGLSGTVVPAAVAQTAQAMDPVVREARTVLDGLKARIPGLSDTLFPRRDIWGEPVTRDALGPDIASPISQRKIQNDPVNRALLDSGYFPGKLGRKIRNVELSDEQYDDYARLAGRMAKTRLDTIVRQPGFDQWPNHVRQDVMQKTVNNAREAARSYILMRNPDILQKAMDAKVERLSN